MIVSKKRWSITRRMRLRCASDTSTLGTLDHFSHFSALTKMSTGLTFDASMGTDYTGFS
jgi:hypothetical protein